MGGMKITTEDIQSLAAKLDALSDEEKMALRIAVASSQDGEVAGFGERTDPRGVSLHFDKIEWVWKAPAGLEAIKPDGKGFLDYEWIA